MTDNSNDTWCLPGATPDTQTVTAQWDVAGLRLIEGVTVREVRHVAKATGWLTEVFRRDWLGDELPIDQIFQVVLWLGGLSAWHAHAHTTDRLFATSGLVRLVLFDARKDSPTHGLVNEFRIGVVRPALVTIPPRIWHGIQAIGPDPACVLNAVDRAYDYEHPDHWRIPADSPDVPYRFPDV